MAITFDLESVSGVLVGVAHGFMPLDEIKQATREIWRLSEGPDIRILWDLRDAEFNLTAADVRELAEFVVENAPLTELRTAFVVSEDLEFGFLRMFEIYRETKGARTSVFRDWKRAVAWLTDDR